MTLASGERFAGGKFLCCRAKGMLGKTAGLPVQPKWEIGMSQTVNVSWPLPGTLARVSAGSMDKLESSVLTLTLPKCGFSDVADLQ